MIIITIIIIIVIIIIFIISIYIITMQYALYVSLYTDLLVNTTV